MKKLYHLYAVIIVNPVTTIDVMLRKLWRNIKITG